MALLLPRAGDTFSLTLVHFTLVSGYRQIPFSEGTLNFLMDIYIPTFTIIATYVLEDLTMACFLTSEPRTTATI